MIPDVVIVSMIALGVAGISLIVMFVQVKKEVICKKCGKSIETQADLVCIKRGMLEDGEYETYHQDCREDRSLELHFFR